MPCHCPTCNCASPDEKYDRNVDYLTHDAFMVPNLPTGITYHISDIVPAVNESVGDLLNQLAFLKQTGDANMATEVSGILNAAVRYDCYLVVIWLGEGRPAVREYLEFIMMGPRHSFEGDAMDGRATLRYDLGRSKTHAGESVAPASDFKLVIEG